MKYLRKAVVLEVHPYDGDAFAALDWASSVSTGNGTYLYFHSDTGLHINTKEGRMKVSIGDWIVCGVVGEFWAIKPDIFALTYEPVQEEF